MGTSNAFSVYWIGTTRIFLTSQNPRYRYKGVEEKVGAEMNVIKDVIFKGIILKMIMFDNCIVVESPGKLPGMVKADNIRFAHFSGNPPIAEFLKVYAFVKEYGQISEKVNPTICQSGCPAR